MEEGEQGNAENYCANCGTPIPPGALICENCARVRSAGKKLARRSYGEVSRSVVVKGTPEGCIKKGVYCGFLTEEQGELLLRLMARGDALTPSVRSVLTSLIKEIAEERHAQRREDRAYVLKEFISAVMPSDDLTRDMSRVFNLN